MLGFKNCSGLGFTIQGLGFRVSDVGIQELFGFRVYDSGFRVYDSGFGVQEFFRVEDSTTMFFDLPRPTRLSPAVLTVTSTSLPETASLSVPIVHVSSSSVIHVTFGHDLPPTPTVMSEYDSEEKPRE